MQVRRLLGSQLIDTSEALQSELQAVIDMHASMQHDTEALSQQRVLLQTSERCLVCRPCMRAV